ncbi:MAG: hypothetical protein LBV20_06560 [Treponema sp.]|jgi:hypothetical protein|nr:hypothetical protein [Treponema sp.]
MTIFIFSSAKKIDLGLDAKTAKLIQHLPLTAAGKHNPLPDDISYIDVSGLDEKETTRMIGMLKRRCLQSPWGIIDPKGIIQDPALHFFNGASDYIGTKTIKMGIIGKRFSQIQSYFLNRNGAALQSEKTAPSSAAKKTASIANKFAGWDTIKTDEICPFFFLYVNFEGKSNLRSRLGENGFNVLKTRLRNLLQYYFSDADALLWMETESNFLFLIPPKMKNAKAVVTACLKILISVPLIISEKFGLINVAADFVFALHYGKTPFKAPGKTGTVISEAVNFIFHLGTKFSKPGRISISESVPADVIPDQLKDMFLDAGNFEDSKIVHSKRFLFSSAE